MYHVLVGIQEYWRLWKRLQHPANIFDWGKGRDTLVPTEIYVAKDTNVRKNRMQDKQYSKWSVRSKTKSAVSFKKAHLVSSSSCQYKAWPPQKQPFLDEIATIQHPYIPSRLQKSRDALFQICTIPMSIYRNKPDTQQTLIVPTTMPQTKKGTRRKHISHILLIVWLLFLCIVGGVLAYGYYYYTTIHTP